MKNDKSKWGSDELIGHVREIFDKLKHKEWDWKSFYNGWLEGRVDMLKIKTYTEKDMDMAYDKGWEDAKRWTSVEDGLPKKENVNFSEKVLTKNRFGNVDIEKYDFEMGCFTGKRYDMKEDGDGQVSEWREIL